MKIELIIPIIAFISISNASNKNSSFEILSDKNKHCVYAPDAKTEQEKRATLKAAAEKFLQNKTLSKGVSELCLAFIKPTSNDPSHGESFINSYGYPGSGFEIIDPGKVMWTFKNNKPEFNVILNNGFERPDAFEYVNVMIKHLNGAGCAIKDEVEGCLPSKTEVKRLVHKDLNIKAHPLDRLIP